MSATFPHTRGDYLFPEWFPEEEDGRAFVETRVEISGIQAFPTLLVVRDWISRFEQSSSVYLIFTSFYKQRKVSPAVISLYHVFHLRTRYSRSSSRRRN